MFKWKQIMDRIIVIFVFSCNFPELIEECLLLLADTAGIESEYWFYFIFFPSSKLL